MGLNATLGSDGWTVELDPDAGAIPRALGDGRYMPTPSAGPNTCYIMGDSLSANGWITTGTPNNFLDFGAEGFHIWANALMDQRLNVIGNVAVGGKTAQQVIDEQLETVVAARPAYVFLSCGVNDLYVSAASAATVFARITTILDTLTTAGITPIWSTVWARSFISSAILDAHLDLNDRLRRYAMTTKNPGIFWDGFRHLVDPTSTQCAGRTAMMYDATIHPNNNGAYYLGKALAAVASSRIPRVPVYGHGAEDQTNATTRDSNILVNPYFSGTGGTAGTGVTGTVPTSWTVDWATRTGTGTAAASIVDVTDPDSGLATAKAIQLVLGGTANASDVLRITQATGFNSLISAGDVVQAECMMRFTSPTFIDGVPMRLQCNTNESTWWGLSNQTKVAFSEGFEVAARTREMTVLGSGAATQARFDVRINCSGAATGTILFWLPRVRKVIT